MIAMRQTFVVIHRYLGLVTAGFLILAGITGSLLAWYHELDAVFNPAAVQPHASSGAASTALDPLLLREKIAEHYPDASVRWVLLRQTPGEALAMGIEGAAAPNDEVYVDRYTGNILGERKWGDISQGTKNLIPFIYRLHYSLALDSVGSYILGVIALLWTIDCFIGVYLTFPVRRRAARTPPRLAARENTWLYACLNWLKRWAPAWKVRPRSNGYKLNFDLHRAGGLWPWAMLLIIAWSSVGFNLGEVYNPVMTSLFSFQSRDENIPALPQPQPVPGLSWFEAREIGRRLMAEEAEAKGFRILDEHWLAYDSQKALYRYMVMSDRDIRDRWGSTSVFFDANTGEHRASFIATGEASGDTITHWLFSLHMAAVWGLPFKVFVTAVGVIVVLLSVTGLVIWNRKRVARARGEEKREAVLSSSWERFEKP